MRKAYLLVYSDATGGREALRSWANRESAVIHWRYDMPHSMYLISESTAADLAKSLTLAVGRRGRFLITEISDNRQGFLPRETWELLRKKSRG
jgi:hypothetical protein